jgi:hypothetical protein
VADHADRRRVALEDLPGDLLEVGSLLEQAQQGGGLLADLGKKARSGLGRWQWLRVGFS